MGTRERGPLTEAMFYVLMSFLGQDMCGIDIAAFVAQRTKGRVSLGPGTLYTILAKFQEEGLLVQTEVDGRKRTYRLTDSGKDTYLEELSRLHTCIADSQQAPSDSEHRTEGGF